MKADCINFESISAITTSLTCGPEMCLCVCACMYVCGYVCVVMCVCVCACVGELFVHVYIVCACECACKSMCMYLSVCLHQRMCTCICMYLVFVCACTVFIKYISVKYAQKFSQNVFEKFSKFLPIMLFMLPIMLVLCSNMNNIN